MASGENPTPKSKPPPYSAINKVAPEENAEASSPTSPGGYPPCAVSSADGGYPQAQPGPGFDPSPATSQPATVLTTTRSVTVLADGRCERCREGRVKGHFTLCGICWAIWCFPFGLICCLTSKERHCDRCGAEYN